MATDTEIGAATAAAADAAADNAAEADEAAEASGDCGPVEKVLPDEVAGLLPAALPDVAGADEADKEAAGELAVAALALGLID